MKTRIMYIEQKGAGKRTDGLPARIGRVTFSKSGKSIHYGDKTFTRCHHHEGNYQDEESGDIYWISGCKKDGEDRRGPGMIEIDDDAREEYWTTIRNQPENADKSSIHCTGKYGGKRPSRL